MADHPSMSWPAASRLAESSDAFSATATVVSTSASVVSGGDAAVDGAEDPSPGSGADAVSGASQFGSWDPGSRAPRCSLDNPGFQWLATRILLSPPVAGAEGRSAGGRWPVEATERTATGAGAPTVPRASEMGFVLGRTAVAAPRVPLRIPGISPALENKADGWAEVGCLPTDGAVKTSPALEINETGRLPTKEEASRTMPGPGAVTVGPRWDINTTEGGDIRGNTAVRQTAAAAAKAQTGVGINRR